MKESVRGWDRDIFHSSVYAPNIHNKQFGARPNPEPGAWSGAPHVGGKDPMPGPLSVAFPGAVAGSHFGSVDLEHDPAQQYGLYTAIL